MFIISLYIVKRRHKDDALTGMLYTHYNIYARPNSQCIINCPACKAGTNAFVCPLQHVKGTGREISLIIIELHSCQNYRQNKLHILKVKKNACYLALATWCLMLGVCLWH